MDLDRLVRGPILLSADNFTPLSRTPWAGSKIFGAYKASLFPDRNELRIGESWEFSCDPDFPSQISGTNLTLSDLVEKKPEELLSSALISKMGSRNCEILVKLLNASSPLSLQVHPEDSDSSLKPNECGKPESWLILDAEEGAGIYLGFSRPVSKPELIRALNDADSAKELLQFVEVKPGDYFEIAPGVPHAVGPGVTLLEPQRIKFGQSGKTYRMWDWGRKYDEKGNLSQESGSPRELHLEPAMKLINPEVQVGDSFVDSTRRTAEIISCGPGLVMKQFPSNSNYQVALLKIDKDTCFDLVIEEGYAAGFALNGDIDMVGDSKQKSTVLKGQPVLLPNASFPIQMHGKMNSEIAIVLPSSSAISISNVRSKSE